MASNLRYNARIRRKERVRKNVRGTDERPRVCVFRSNKHVYAQVISDEKGATLVSASTLAGSGNESATAYKGVEAAKRLGLMLAQKCKEKNISNVIFDRNGFLFHGQVKAVADGAREGGLEF
ncbi:MAG: 50S ribosomal protein L18 [Deltaproteobacteria bacterium]|nr:50S ribosomal protein L18 [Deltaproteobacteria bacterium]